MINKAVQKTINKEEIEIYSCGKNWIYRSSCSSSNDENPDKIGIFLLNRYRTEKKVRHRTVCPFVDILLRARSFDKNSSARIRMALKRHTVLYRLKCHLTTLKKVNNLFW